MWRYKIPKPTDYNLDMASERESGAYKEEWIDGGKALGGADEAVINKFQEEISTPKKLNFPIPITF
jgi:hypothetical protein